mmetsp:Transcript_3004/g.4645  ORF Transcript_3004/g.4645 Transcript_3004/m.4645 type:complete len:1347 (+) Transcript_3004:98-4138(+)
MDNSVGSTLTTKMQKLCLNFDVTETNLFFVVAISDATEFTDQLISVFENQGTMMLLLKFIESMLKLTGNLSIEDFIESINQVKETLGESEDSDELQEVKQKISDILDPTISQLLPQRHRVRSADGIDSYFEQCENLVNILVELANLDFEFKNLDLLDFWVSFMKLVLDSHSSGQLVFDLAEAAEQVGENFIYQEEFRQAVNEALSEVRDPEQVERFMFAYYKILLENVPECIQEIAGYLENPGIWRYSSKIINTLVVCSSLRPKNLPEQLQTGRLELEETEYNTQIEICLEKLGLESNFAVLLSDFMSKYYEVDFDDSYAHFEILKQEYDFEKFPNIKQLVRITFLREFIRTYLDEEMNEEGMEEFLHNSDLGSTLQLYALKQLPSKDYLELNEYLQEKGWLGEFLPIKPTSNLEVFPYFEGSFYSETCLKLNEFRTNFDFLDQAIEAMSSKTKAEFCLEKAVLGVCFMNEVFVKHAIGGFNENFRVWVDTKADFIKEKLGYEYYSLLRCFIFNFTQNSSFKLEEGMPLEDLHKVLLKVLTAVIFVSYSRIECPLTSLFFDGEGKIHEDLPQRFNQGFVFGSEPSSRYVYFKGLLDNYDSMRNAGANWRNGGTGTYKCADDCDYIYLVQNCGGCVVEVPCPYCRRTIGGINHTPHARPGHENISDERAKQLLNQRIEKYATENSTGRSLEEGCDVPPRKLELVPYMFMNMVLNCSMEALLELNLVESMDGFFEAPNNFFDSRFEYQFERLQTLTGTEEIHVWLYKVATSLPTVMANYADKPCTRQSRDQFERDVQERVVKPTLESVEKAILNYKKSIQANFTQEEDSISTYIQELKLPEYPLMRLFRVISQPDFEMLSNQLQVSRRSKLLEIYFNNEEGIKKLACLTPIVELTNELLEIYNHKISREEARNTTIEDVLRDHPRLTSSFEEFLEAWDKAEFSFLQYECKQLPLTSFSRDSELLYFLIDNKEQGGGMYMAAALSQLAQIQNNLLLQFQEALSEMRRSQTTADKNRYPIQTISGNFILEEMFDESDLFAFSINNPDYGLGKELVYELERMEYKIIGELPHKKLLNEEKLTFIHFHFELLNNSEGSESGLIQAIRERIPQTRLEGLTEKEITRFFEQESKTQNFRNLLRELHSSLSYILCYLKNSKESPDSTISSFCNNLRGESISEHFKNKDPLCNVKLRSVIHLFEEIETRYFPYILAGIKTDFKSEENKEDVELRIRNLARRCESNQQHFPTVNELKEAVMRFICRCLTADLNSNHPLQCYIGRYDLWSVSESKRETLEENFPVEIPLSNTYIVHTVLENYCRPPEEEKAPPVAPKGPAKPKKQNKPKGGMKEKARR